MSETDSNSSNPTSPTGSEHNDEDTAITERPEVIENLLQICKTYNFLDILEVNEVYQLKTLVLNLSTDLRTTTDENALLYKAKDALMVENMRLKQSVQTDIFYREKIHQLHTTNTEALQKLNQQQNQIVEMCNFLEDQREKYSTKYVTLFQKTRDKIGELNAQIERLNTAKCDVEIELAGEKQKVTQLNEEAVAIRQKCEEFLGEDAEKLSQIEGLQNRIESMLADHQRMAQQMAESNRQQAAQIEALNVANAEQALKLQSSYAEIEGLNEKLTAQNTVVSYQKKLMQELTANKCELTSKLAHLNDELTASKKEVDDLKLKVTNSKQALAELTETNRQLQATVKQRDLELVENEENANRQLQALQEKLAAAEVQRSDEMAKLREQFDATQADIQVTIDKSTQTCEERQAKISKLQDRIEKLEADICGKDTEIAELMAKMDKNAPSTNTSFNIEVGETESPDMDGDGVPPKSNTTPPMNFGFVKRPKLLTVNLGRRDSLSDDFSFVSDIGMTNDSSDDTDFESIDGQSVVNEPVKKKMRSSFPPVEKPVKGRLRRAKSPRSNKVSDVVSEVTATSFSFSGLTSLGSSCLTNFPKKMSFIPKP